MGAGHRPVRIFVYVITSKRGMGTGASCIHVYVWAQDTDPYVRKTAAICVAKLYDIAPDLAAERGFLDMLRDMTSDANPMVVSNTVAALSEIYALDGAEVLAFSKTTTTYLLSAMEQCTEWGQVCTVPHSATCNAFSPCLFDQVDLRGHQQRPG